MILAITPVGSDALVTCCRPLSSPPLRIAGRPFFMQERATLEWAKTLTLISDTHAPEEVYRDIAAHFTEKEIADATIALGLTNVYGIGAKIRSCLPVCLRELRSQPQRETEGSAGPERTRTDQWRIPD